MQGVPTTRILMTTLADLSMGFLIDKKRQRDVVLSVGSIRGSAPLDTRRYTLGHQMIEFRFNFNNHPFVVVGVMVSFERYVL
jgi:hypothetical protein